MPSSAALRAGRALLGSSVPGIGARVAPPALPLSRAIRIFPGSPSPRPSFPPLVSVGGGAWVGVSVTRGGGFPFRARAMCSKAAEGIKVVQELPSKKFWHETYEELVSIGGEDGDSSAKVAKWLKKPREPVSKGDVLLELEVAGNFVIEMRAEAGGFMGKQLVLEGEKLSEGQAATYITESPEPLPHVSSSAESELLDAAGGSVRQLHEDLAQLQVRRQDFQSDLADALRLAVAHLGASPLVTCGACRVPGEERAGGGGGGMFIAPHGVFPQEVTKDDLLELDIEQVATNSDGTSADGSAQTSDLHRTLASTLLSCPNVSAVILAQTPCATALSMTPEGIPGVPTSPLNKDLTVDVSHLSSSAALSVPGYGLLVTGNDFEHAYCSLWELERQSSLTLKARQAGVPGGHVAMPAAVVQGGRDAGVWFQALKRSLRQGVTLQL